MTALPYRGRFAPSPSGPLHFGSIVTAVASHADALAHDGQWLLRIDDVDQARTRSGARDAILRTLDAFGFTWDGEVIDQSSREPRYATAITRLSDRGLVYPCTCSRREIAAQGHTGREGIIYPGTCRRGPFHPDRAGALRIVTDDREISIVDRIAGHIHQRIESEVGDFVVRRADGFTAYQLAVVLDDADQRISHVVRGADLLWSTPRQIYLQHLLELPTPDYAHVPLVLDPRGRKLSKRDDAHPVDDRRPLPTLLHAWQFLGQALPDTPHSPEEFWQAVKKHWRIGDVPS